MGSRPSRYEPLSRRSFVTQLSRSAFGLLVVGVAATSCGSDVDQGSDAASPSPGTTGDGGTDGDDAAAGSGTAVEWTRVDLGFVSAYVLVRSGEAAVVDTGVEGSEGDITAALATAGVGWADVGSVILTHRHPDHVGSVPAVLERATEATPYAGVEDIPAITSPRSITAVSDGDTVFGLDVVATPGHTAGHISVLDPVGGLLVAGDALNGSDGGIIGPNPQFTDDMDVALRSVDKLAELEFETAVFGHGDPVTSGAAAQVRALLDG